MNNFYSANGKLSKYNIIENFDSPNDGVSLISHLIDYENHKNKVSELETNINNFDLLVINRINEVKGLLPYNNKPSAYTGPGASSKDSKLIVQM